MKRILLSIAICCIAFSLSAAKKAKTQFPYQNPQLSVEERVNDLIGRMTLEEKVGQLRCTLAWNYYTIKGKDVVPSELFKKDIAEGQIGMLWGTYRADPWTQKSLENGLNPELAAKAGNALQKYVMENTRLGIPLFLAEEAPHGHMAIGTTVFPTGFGMAATWDPALIEKAGEVIGREVRLQGGHISYGPVLDLAREPRWSRVEETMGEDPVLTGELGAAMVKGLGGGDLSKPWSTIATLKHFIGYGTTEGGQNGAITIAGERELRESFLPPFKKAIDAGALSVMTSYNSLDGIPSTASKALLTNLLRNEWGFKRRTGKLGDVSQGSDEKVFTVKVREGSYSIPGINKVRDQNQLSILNSLQDRWGFQGLNRGQAALGIVQGNFISKLTEKTEGDAE